MEQAIEVDGARSGMHLTALAAMSERGDLAVIGDHEAVRWLDGRDLASGVVAIAIVESELWLVADHAGAHRLRRLDRAGQLVAETTLGRLGSGVHIAVTRRGPRSALIEGERAVFVREQDGELAVEDLGERRRDRRVLIGGRGVAERRGNALVFRGGTLALPADLAASTIVGGALVLDGAAVLVELDHAGRRSAVLFDVRRGAVRMRIRLGDARVLAIAERRGLIVLGRGSHVALFDLRLGRCIGERILPATAAACGIDADATRLVVIDGNGKTHELAPSLADWTAPAPTDADEPSESNASDEPRELDEPSDSDETTAISEPHTRSSEDQPVQPDAPFHAPLLADNARPVIPEVLCALGSAPAALFSGGELDAYLADARALIDALAATALATRLPTTTDGQDPLAAARAHERTTADRFAQWNRRGAPHIEVARELGLSPLASMLLLLAAAPQIWGELARVYARCTDDQARPLVDELLLAHLLNAGTSSRSAIARELDDDAPLIASGAVERGTGLRPYASIQVHVAIARRLAGGAPPAEAGSSPVAPALERIIGPVVAIGELAQRLAEPTDPPRIVIRGRTGSGRRSLAAAFAARAGRRLGTVSVNTSAPDLDVRLRRQLRDVALRGDLPCVSLDEIPDDPAVRARIRVTLDAHRGPLFLRAPVGGEMPLAAGYHDIELPPLTELERRDAWRTILAERGGDPACADELAARFDVGVGTMIRACADRSRPIADTLRQHRSKRIEAIASRVDRLASWDQLVVPTDIAEALQEVCARVRHRSTVLRAWGMDSVAATAQGVVALFQGGPGTGKTMAAGAIARALGFELWRVDLAKVVSKWIGETEKNLAAVFDAAEQGECVLLFDEADSLFAKRTEVKSSNERNANLETNYLLQRLDSFSGVAILTTNFGTAIDPAFKRRVSVHVEFPFPDETDRERLWRAHLPPSLPREGELDLAALARRYPISGGYIRNAALRAAYLAAAGNERLTDRHLHRAVALEYQRTGKLGEGRLE